MKLAGAKDHMNPQGKLHDALYPARSTFSRSSIASDAGQRAAAGARCLGARLLPAVQKREAQVFWGSVEFMELGRRGAGMRRRVRWIYVLGRRREV